MRGVSVRLDSARGGVHLVMVAIIFRAPIESRTVLVFVVAPGISVVL
jgi:hypothetical protein